MNNKTWSEWLSENDFAELYYTDGALPKEFGDLQWDPVEADKVAAWKLYTELRTRITTQPIAFRAGDEKSALKSVYDIFGLSRSIINEYVGCTHFAALTIYILNVEIRPFTAKWHRLNMEGRLENADVRFHFRSELQTLQPRLRKFAALLGVMAGDAAAIANASYSLAPEYSSNSSGIWDPLPFGIECKLGESEIHELNRLENEEIAARRKFYGLANEKEDASVDAVGLAISGGGIRSATFALGVVQTLARKGILRDVDFLSTVSGGGYLGAFISSFLNDAHNGISLSAKSGNQPFGAKGDPESLGVRHLRNHGKYLSEGGLKTLAIIVAQIVYGSAISFLLLLPFLFSAVLVNGVIFGGLLGGVVGDSAVPKIINQYFPFLFVGVIVLFPLVQTYSKSEKVKNLLRAVCISVAVVSIYSLTISQLPYFLNFLAGYGGSSSLLIGAMLFPISLGVLAFSCGLRSRISEFILRLFWLTGPIILIAIFIWLSDVFFVHPSENSLRSLISLIVGTGIYTSILVNINLTSPHNFYKNRLAKTYLTKSTSDLTGIENVPVQLLSKMNLAAKAPYHLINAALNIPGSKDPNLRGRNSDFFVFSKHFCGSPITGFFPTKDWEHKDSNLGLSSAIAISGAAAAPHMGTLTASRYTFLLAMLNVRLGYWLRRPDIKVKPSFLSLLPPIGWLYFWRELTGHMTEKMGFFNLSDGGHIENLGIYELLRRRCKFIIAIDGEEDSKYSFAGLLKLTQLAKIDLGVSIEPDLSDLRLNNTGNGHAHFSLSKIEYSGNRHGFLLYIKSSLTGNESEFLKHYRDENPDFPHQPTTQQLFSEMQFEAYRSLGEHIAEDLFRPDLVGKWENDGRVRQWFKGLAKHLL